MLDKPKTYGDLKEGDLLILNQFNAAYSYAMLVIDQTEAITTVNLVITHGVVFCSTALRSFEYSNDYPILFDLESAQIFRIA